MISAPQPLRSHGPRKSILDLAPLELDCMNALWPLGEASVREIRQALAVSRPRAYTTIMTILDRLAHKGVVLRRKAGRAYLYRPNLTAEEARTHALEQVVEGFFDGSADALAAHLLGEPARAAESTRSQRRITAAQTGEPDLPSAASARAEKTPLPAPRAQVFEPTRLDESLL